MIHLPTIGVSIEIFNNYPENVTAIPVVDESTNLWGACIVKASPDEIYIEDFDRGMYSVLYSLDSYEYRNQKEALDAITHIVESSVRIVKTMCN